MLRNDYAEKIIEIMKEDSGQPEYIIKMDLNRYLESIIDDERQDAYEDGVEETKAKFDY